MQKTWQSRQEMLDDLRSSELQVYEFWECYRLFGGCGITFAEKPQQLCQCGGRLREQIWHLSLPAKGKLRL